MSESRCEMTIVVDNVSYAKWSQSESSRGMAFASVLLCYAEELWKEVVYDGFLEQVLF